MAVNVGDTIKDNDPRMSNRNLVVVATDGIKYAYCEDVRYFRRHRILLNRIFDDSKPRRSGFSVVERATGGK